MQFQEFRSNFLENQYHLSRYKTATFSAIVVAMGFAISHYYQLGILTSALVIGAQSVTGVNRGGPFRIRLRVALGAAIVLSLSSVLGALSGIQPFLFSFLWATILAFIFGWSRQLFPLNWPDIIIPAGVLFFFNYTQQAVCITLTGSLIGIACELLLGLFIYIKRYCFSKKKLHLSSEDVLLPPPVKGDSTILGLKKFLFLYSIELSILLWIGFFLIRYTPYPHAYWMPLTAVIVLKVGRRETVKRVIERTVGTALGCLLSGGLLLLLPPAGFISMAVMVVCIFLWICFLRSNYAVGTIFITTYVLLLSNDSEVFSSVTVMERIVFTAIGGVMAIGVSLAFLVRERL